MAMTTTAAGYEFIVAQLRENNHATYADIKDAADQRKLPVFPIMYGRAKAALGLIPSKKPGRKTGEQGPRRPSASKKQREPGRAPRVATGSKSERIRALLGSGKTPSQIASQVDCSVNLVYAIRSRTDASGSRTRGGAAARRTGQPRKVAARAGRPGVDGPLAAVQDLVSNLQEHARQTARMRETLEEIGRMIDRVT